MQHFACDDHYCAYPGELQPSISVTTHAAHVLASCGADNSGSLAYLLERQLPDGRWPGDKWNGAWLYTTSHALVVLCHTPNHNVVMRAVEALLAYQHIDGGWGSQGSSTEETAYGLLGLRAVNASPFKSPRAAVAQGRAERWMLENYRPFAESADVCWLGKETYRPRRLARVIELASTLPTSA